MNSCDMHHTIYQSQISDAYEMAISLNNEILWAFYAH